MMEGFQQAYVLHSRPYTDSRLLVDWFTRNSGRVSSVARLPKAKNTTVYQQFRRGWVIFKGRSALKTLVTVEFDTPARIDVHYDALKCAFYLNELVVRALPEGDPNEELFESYSHALSELLQRTFDGTQGQGILRNFELDCLRLLGFAVDFTCDCQSGVAVTPERSYRLLPQEGFTACSNVGESAFMGSSLLAIEQRCFDTPQVLSDAKRICRRLIAEMIGDKPLKSRELFR